MLYGMAAMPLVNLDLTDINKEHAQTEPGMAHFAGTGPVGATCGKCVFWGYKTASRVRYHNGCKKYSELMKKDGPAINPSLPACKYYKETAAPVEPPRIQPYRDDTDDPAPHSSEYHD
jgi:hypothetical protein